MIRFAIVHLSMFFFKHRFKLNFLLLFFAVRMKFFAQLQRMLEELETAGRTPSHNYHLALYS